MSKSLLPSLFLSMTLFTLSCDSGTKNVDSCGDGFIDPGEECDGTVGEASCASLGHYRLTGELACNANCTFDRDDCGGRCGDNTVDTDGGEECDGENLNLNSCASLGFGGGELACDAGCRFDTAGCARICGNGYLEGEEGCDDANTDVGDGCSDTCVIEDGWTCAGTNPTVCAPICQDGQALGDEACDGTDLGDQTCELLGYHGGVLACSETCAFDLAPCEAEGRCGDETVQPAYGETCDGDDFGASSCLDLNLFFGAPACDAACALTTGTCRAAEQWGIAGVITQATAIGRDATGHVYVAGNTGGALSGQTHQGGIDSFLRKYSPAGEHLWTRQWGTTADDVAAQLALTPTGDIFVTGNTAGALEGQTHAGETDIFLVKFNAAGDRLWSSQWGTSAADLGTAVAVDATGNAYVTGSTGGALEGQTPLGQTDMFLTKVTPDGVRSWTLLAGTVDYTDEGQDITWSANHLYITGTGDSRRCFLRKYTESGALLLDLQIQNSTNCYAQEVAVSVAGDIYLAGWTAANMWDQFHEGNGDNFLYKFSAVGVRQWARLWGTQRADQVYELALDSAGNLVTAGLTDTSLDLIDGQQGPGWHDIFISTFTTDGTRTGTRLFGTAQADFAFAFVLDAQDRALLCGYTQGALGGQLTGTSDAFLMFVPDIP